jgi:hypothetical protein
LDYVEENRKANEITYLNIRDGIDYNIEEILKISKTCMLMVLF